MFKIVQCKGGPAGELDPDVKAYLDQLESGGKPLSETTPEELRSGPSSTKGFEIPPADVNIDDLTFKTRDGVERVIRRYQKTKGEVSAPLMFFHGGCWVFCSIDTHDSICRYMCEQTGFTVFSVDYRLAPESKYPTGIQDAFDASLWVHHNREHLQLTPDDLLVFGDSAGGNISLAVSALANKNPVLNVRGQMLFYPITDASKMDTESYELYREGYLLTKEMMGYGANHYVENSEELSDPLISPLLAKDLSIFPKTLIQTAEWDVLRDEAEALAQVMNEAGVDVECVRYNGLIHAYQGMAGKMPAAKVAVDDAVAFFNRFK